SGTLTDAQRAGVTDPVAKNLLQYIPTANDASGARFIGSGIAPVNLDQYTLDVRHNLKQSDDLHWYYAYQRDIRQEPNAQGNTVPGLNIGGPAGFPSGRIVTTFAAGDTATYLRGRHVIKFGGEFRRVSHNGFNGDAGRMTYPSVAAFQQGFGNAFSITLGDQS